MASKVRWVVIGAAALATGGCSNLHQSALVYSSQNNIGLVVKGGSAQAGNVDLTLGYSGLDFAIVPVAVAETCNDLTKPQECDETKYRLVRIEGVNTIDAAAQALAGLASQLTEETRVRLLEKPALVQQLATIDDNLRQIATKATLDDEIRRKNTELDALKVKPAPDEVTEREAFLAFQSTQSNDIAAVTQQIAVLESRKGALESLEATNNSTVRNSVAEKIAQIDAAVQENERKLQKIIDRSSQSSTDLKRDALSVYGEFGGDTTTEGTNAGLQVGKIFSTGVAAQFLTQHMGQALAMQGRTKCVANALAAIDRNERLKKEATTADYVALYKAAFVMCGEPPAKPVA